MGAGGRKTRRPVQEGLRVDVPVRLRAAPERGGFLADPAHGQRGSVLDGAAGVRRGGGSRGGQAHPLGGGQGRLARGRGGGGPRRDTPGVPPTLGLAGAPAGGEVVATDQRGAGQRALRGDRRDRGGADGALCGTARSKRTHQEPHQLPLVAPGGVMLRELFSRIRYKPKTLHWSRGFEAYHV